MDFLPSLSFLGLRTCLVFSGGVFTVWFLRGVAAQRKRNPRRLSLPPGPKGLPIVGNILDMPTVKPWKEYAAMARQYGDLVYLNMLGQGILIVGSLPPAVELLEKRAANNSDRPSAPALELIDLEWPFGLMPYGPEWKQHRRVFHQYLNHNAVSNFHPVMYEETVNLLRTLSKDPQDFIEHMKMCFGTMILRSAYGFDDVGQNEALIRDSQALTDAATETTAPGKFLVNIFPVLKYVPEWFPGAGYQTYFRETAEISHRVRHSPFESAKLDTANGKRSVHPSMATALIDSLQQESEEKRAEIEFVARCICATSYAAGAETTVSASIGIIYILATHPEIQRKAQSELDAVIGSDRLPTIDHRASLPYVHAIVKEISRWYTVLPLGMPHTSMEDDDYRGYFIPKGTFIMANSWAILHDAELFERPFEFIPERYLKDGKIDPLALDAETAAFGFGRRICPGRFFSINALFLFTASLLATFEVAPPKDSSGNPLPMTELDFVDLTVAKPLPFDCDLTLRPGREGLLH